MLSFNSLQNAEALAKGVTTAMMGQAQASKYRHYDLG